jgi:hypothetical protein
MNTPNHRQRLTVRIVAAMGLSLVPLTGCPKPIPDDPQPAGPCKPPNHCTDEPHQEAPPPIGSNPPAPK